MRLKLLLASTARAKNHQKPALRFGRSSLSHCRFFSSERPSHSDTNPPAPSPFRVVSYNILSPELASPSYFIKCDPTHLDGPTRLEKIFTKLDEQIRRTATSAPRTPVIFCLQEVSRSWVGKFHVFFESRNYVFVTGSYGVPKNGYMGVAMAYPRDSFELSDVDVSRLSDVRKNGWPAETTFDLDNETSLWKRLFLRFLIRPLGTIWNYGQPESEREQHWEVSQNRHNVILTLFLSQKNHDRTTKNTRLFTVSTYHMPCFYYKPMVMTIHTDMAIRHVQSLAAGSPYIFAGDFNFIPESSTYRLATTGTLGYLDASYPTGKYGMEWESVIRGMTSAYKELEGSELKYTISTQVKGQEPFKETLDYIFISKNDWKVINVEKRNDEVIEGPFPNEDEPSDHVLIAADLQLGLDRDEEKAL